MSSFHYSDPDQTLTSLLHTEILVALDNTCIPGGQPSGSSRINLVVGQTLVILSVGYLEVILSSEACGAAQHNIVYSSDK
jgi:hypothetical protein